METTKKESINDEVIYLNDGLEKQLKEILQKIDNIPNEPRKPGEVLLSCSLIFNALDYLDIYIDCLKKLNVNFDSKTIKICVIALCSFYECYFKFWIRHKEIIKDPNNQFRAETITSEIISEKHNHQISAEKFKCGDFCTIGLVECLNLVKEKGLLTGKEKNLIKSHNRYRNLFIHYEIRGDKLIVGYYRWPLIGNALLININEFYNDELKIIQKLLFELKNMLKDEKDLINRLPKNDCLFILVENYFRPLEQDVIPKINSYYIPELNTFLNKQK